MTLERVKVTPGDAGVRQLHRGEACSRRTARRETRSPRPLPSWKEHDSNVHASKSLPVRLGGRGRTGGIVSTNSSEPSIMAAGCDGPAFPIGCSVAFGCHPIHARAPPSGTVRVHQRSVSRCPHETLPAGLSGCTGPGSWGRSHDARRVGSGCAMMSVWARTAPGSLTHDGHGGEPLRWRRRTRTGTGGRWPSTWPP